MGPIELSKGLLLRLVFSSLNLRASWVVTVGQSRLSTLVEFSYVRILRVVNWL